MMPIAAAVAALSAVASALFAAADGALTATSARQFPPTLSRFDSPDYRDRVQRSLAITRLASNVVMGIAATMALALHTFPFGWRFVGGTIMLLLIALVIDAVPRAFGESRSTAVIIFLSPLLRAAEVLLKPLVTFELMLESRSRAGGLSASVSGLKDTTEQFREAVAASSDVSRDEREILRGAFSLRGTEAQEIMAPRIAMIALENLTSWSEVLARVRSAEHARFPVFNGTIDRITGILYAKDLLPAVIEDTSPPGGWLSLVRPAVFIPEGKRIDVLLREFKATGTHIAIVVDEYGGTAGMVTIEDILEEIVGEIRDEHDREELPIEAEHGGKFWVSGRVSLDDLSHALGQRIGNDDTATVGGLVFSMLGRVPRAGEQLMLDGFRIVVERVVQRRVDRVYFERDTTWHERTA
ncbi:MAG: HlyC/CorC family transporter [Anaerolineae bacterium]|nr:HlyC/CorC family transporter [Gemmatimonadaceae bacterium]